jgi:S-DNA-T family DNA segregation ATPase FtsK/SpoIIIE
MVTNGLHIRAYKGELIALLITVAAVFLGLSLYSYSPYDASWFFYTSGQGTITNLCGSVGAQAAGILFYLFGGSSMLLVPMLLFASYLVVRGRSFKYEWERLAAFGSFLLVSAALSHLHQTDFFSSQFNGGHFGYGLCSFLYRFFDYVGTTLFLYTALAISFVVMTRLSFIVVAQYAVMGAQKTYEFLRDYRVPQHMYHYTVLMLFYASRPVIWCAHYIKHLLDGSALEGTGLMLPEAGLEEEQEEQAIVSLEDMAPLALDTLDALDTFSDEFQEDELPEEDTVFAVQPASQNSIEPKKVVLPVPPIQRLVAQKHVPSREYRLPRASIFVGLKDERDDESVRDALQERAKILEEKLERFGVSGQVVSIKRGPVVTLFEYEPDIDTKISKILALEDDLALALQAMSIRILAPIPGRSVVGFEVANHDRRDVHLAKIIQSEKYRKFSGSLPLVLGQDTIGNEVIVDLVRMPHLLIAGSTGSGKSVALNTILISMLCKCTPDELKLILIDPKRLEFASYADIAHLLFPIVTDPRKAAPILRWVVHQMEERYEMMSRVGVRNVKDYNMQCSKIGLEPLPYIVVIIDELADLMMTTGRDIEDLIARITQMARAAGIHMIVATQRPSVDVITGLIKVNFPSRVSFRVTSKVDSRTILDCSGADKLLGRGDMLFLDSTTSLLKRVHGAYVSDEEIEQVVSHIKSERQVEYLDIAQELASGDGDTQEGDEELLQQVVCFLDEIEDVSISLLQRKFRIGYNRSARIIDLLESRGLIMPADGGKTRKVVR